MDEEWEIPPRMQPDPASCGFDLDRALNAVVGLRARVPADAFTAGTLGTERVGHGVVIAPDGLVLTIGYLVTEAESVWLRTLDGRAVAAHVLGYDQATGFGLLQPLGRLDLPALDLGVSGRVDAGESVLLAASGGRPHAMATRVVARQPFAGHWEYLLEEALFTAPAHPFWSGAALIGGDGALLGIGSLVLQQQEEGGGRLDANLCVPVDCLKPILGDLLTYGGVRRPPRPWLGLYAAETGAGVHVQSVAAGGPAEQAGVQAGDRIVMVADAEIADLAGLWREVWATGEAGSLVRLRLARRAGTIEMEIRSADRAALLKAPRLH